MKYIRETGETHSKLLYHAWSRWSAGRSRYTMHGQDGLREKAVTKCKVQGDLGKKSSHNARSRWSAGRSRYTMHGPGGPREEDVTQCMVQVVRGKNSLHNAWCRWSVGRSRHTMHGPGGPREVRFVMVVMVRGVQCMSCWLHRHTIIMTVTSTHCLSLSPVAVIHA